MSAQNIRTFDVNGRVRRAGCLIFKDDTHQEILVVTSRKNLLITPAGGVEPDETIFDAAKREAREEAGVLGNIGVYLGPFKSSTKHTTTHIFTMYMTDILSNDLWPESKLRNRLWVKRGDNNLNYSPELLEYLAQFDAIRDKEYRDSIFVST